MIDHFSLLAPLYDKVFSYKENPFLTELLHLPSDGPILDAGGGTGRVAQALQEDTTIIVADASFEMLRQARNKGLRAVYCYTECLPFAEDSFGRVLMVDAFHHVNNQQETARELWRVLQYGGRIVILEPDVERFAVRLLALFEKLAWMRSHFRRLSEILDLFPSEGALKSGQKRHHNLGVVIEKQSGG